MISLFLVFLKIGLFTFGGGWAMIPLIEKEVVERKKWLSPDDFLDALVIAQLLPGILAVNMAIMVGQKFGRKGASLVATLGAVLPSFVIILLIAIFFTRIQDAPTVSAIFKGIRPAVVALIIVPVITMSRNTGLTWENIWIPAAAALLIWLAGVSPIYVILTVAAGSVVFQYIKNRKK